MRAHRAVMVELAHTHAAVRAVRGVPGNAEHTRSKHTIECEYANAGTTRKRHAQHQCSLQDPQHSHIAPHSSILISVSAIQKAPVVDVLYVPVNLAAAALNERRRGQAGMQAHTAEASPTSTS